MNKKESINHDLANIDFHACNFVGFNKYLKSLLSKDPDTLTALLDASYINMSLRAQALETYSLMQKLIDREQITITK